MVFLQSYMIMPDGHSLETENKKICQISGLKWSNVSGLALIPTLVKILLNWPGPVPLMQKDIITVQV